MVGLQGAVRWKTSTVGEAVNIGLLITKRSPISREIGADLTKPFLLLREACEIIQIRTLIKLSRHQVTN